MLWHPNKRKVPLVTTISYLYIYIQPSYSELNQIGGVMISVLASSAVDHGFEPRSGQTKDYEFGICCFSAMHAALRRNSKEWLDRRQNEVSEWSDMSTRGMLFQ
jgi:hypothetical protein